MAAKSFSQRIAAAVKWLLSPTGRYEIGVVVAALTAIYTALHRAGV